MRNHTRRDGMSGEMIFDTSNGQVTRSEPDSLADRYSLGTFGDAAKVTAVRATTVAGENETFRIPCISGRTPSYALRVATDQKQQWLVVSGLTGVFEKVDDEQKVANIFAGLASHDAR
ncbi:MAG: hypothetical protein JWM57_1096 [Phycisphaerales bacterium]|nr:hypothetical protein [Phycisphaerales bacterium]